MTVETRPRDGAGPTARLPPQLPLLGVAMGRGCQPRSDPVLPWQNPPPAPLELGRKAQRREPPSPTAASGS